MNDTPQSPSPPGESQRLKAAIARFLREDRLQPKLDKLEKQRSVGEISIDEYSDIRQKTKSIIRKAFGYRTPRKKSSGCKK